MALYASCPASSPLDPAQTKTSSFRKTPLNSHVPPSATLYAQTVRKVAEQRADVVTCVGPETLQAAVIAQGALQPLVTAVTSAPGVAYFALHALSMFEGVVSLFTARASKVSFSKPLWRHRGRGSVPSCWASWPDSTGNGSHKGTVVPGAQCWEFTCYVRSCSRSFAPLSA